MKTIMPKQIKWEERKWYIIDASGLNLWRLASKIATIIRWKNKVDFAPHVDNGDYVIVLNAWKIKVTWNKMEDKKYYRHTGYLWWLKETNLNKLLDKKPFKALELAVNGMLPKNKLRDNMIERLKLVEGSEHKYVAQAPKEITL